jgi:hypothetical protein
MRLVLLMVVLALVAGCGEDDEPAAPAVADLTVEVDADGPGGRAAKTATVRCDAPEDCPQVDALDPELFEPTPGDVACTQQYGGPETAKVTGTFKGEPVDAEFARRNGCEIARWEDAARLLEAAG